MVYRFRLIQIKDAAFSDAPGGCFKVPRSPVRVGVLHYFLFTFFVGFCAADVVAVCFSLEEGDEVDSHPLVFAVKFSGLAGFWR